MPLPWLVPALFAVGQAVISEIQQKRQQKRNEKLAATQAAADTAFLDKQNSYNTPAMQMSRFQDAGLNPHLIYGQGTPGNQSSPQQYPKIESADIQRVGADMLPTYNQSALTQSQVAATDAKTRQIGVLTQLNELQAKVMEKNPLLNTDAYKAIIDSLKSTAEIKASESGIRLMDKFFAEATRGTQADKVFREVELLEQRFKLGAADLKIKAEILNSMEFKNAILEVQKKFMTDGDITPQHILQFIQLLLMKSL